MGNVINMKLSLVRGGQALAILIALHQSATSMCPTWPVQIKQEG